ncbi:MAG: GspH/FimT family pseudopilin [Rhodoferax sp.]|nr:GspH/FimT family pseudopilin [Rhodoferax sp.]
MPSLTLVSRVCHDLATPTKVSAMKPPFNPAKPTAYQLGFTIIELLVVIVILGVLAALAAPSFTETIKRYRVNSIRDSMTSAIQLAKSDAIRRRVPVTLLRTTGCGVTLSTVGDWDCGWQMFVDADNDGVLDSGEVVLQEFTVPGGYHLTNDSATASDAISVTRFGQPATVTETTSNTKRFVVSPRRAPLARQPLTFAFSLAVE